MVPNHKTMNIFQDAFGGEEEDDLKARNDVPADNDDIGENTELTPLGEALKYSPLADSENKEQQDKLENNRPGATNANQDLLSIPTVTPDNDNGEAGPSRK
jgi:hypothetical protein